MHSPEECWKARSYLVFLLLLLLLLLVLFLILLFIFLLVCACQPAKRRLTGH